MAIAAGTATSDAKVAAPSPSQIEIQNAFISSGASRIAQYQRSEAPSKGIEI